VAKGATGARAETRAPEDPPPTDRSA
jgi:hypothetical protein